MLAGDQAFLLVAVARDGRDPPFAPLHSFVVPTSLSPFSVTDNSLASASGNIGIL